MIIGIVSERLYRKNSKKIYYEQLFSKNCSNSKRKKFSLMQRPRDDVERKEMESIPYSSIVGSLMYAQTCTRPDISFSDRNAKKILK